MRKFFQCLLAEVRKLLGPRRIANSLHGCNATAACEKLLTQDILEAPEFVEEIVRFQKCLCRSSESEIRVSWVKTFSERQTLALSIRKRKSWLH
jgi:hypothetical protein